MLNVKGIWLRREGDYAVVLMEIGGKMVELIREHVEGPFSHYIHPAGIRTAIENTKPANDPKDPSTWTPELIAAFNEYRKTEETK